MVVGLTVMNSTVNGRCEDCILGKQVRHPFNQHMEPETAPYERVALNIWGPSHVQTTGGKSLMLVVTDQGGTECTIWFLANKVAKTTMTCFEAFDVCAENQWGW